MVRINAQSATWAICGAFFLLAICFGGPLEEVSANAQPTDLWIEDDNVLLLLNNGNDAKSRFSLYAKLPDGKKQNLLYGTTSPWTSYTTIRIDGVDYVFGGPTGRRAGRDGLYGTFLSQRVTPEGEFVSAYRFGDGILVEQTLRLVPSVTSTKDTSVVVDYRIQNTSSEPRDVGLRIVFDTMLGDDDGAPIRFGENIIYTDSIFRGEEVPLYWQAFDRISTDGIVSEGFLVRRGLLPPDVFVVSNWGNFADNLWDVELVPGRDFGRRPGEEYELDSAVALYWEPRVLNPFETFTFSTMYGVGGVSSAEGLFAVGVVAPETVYKGEKFFATAYIENITSEERYVTFSVETSEGLRFTGFPGGTGVWVAPKSVVQFYWPLTAVDGSLHETLAFHVVSDQGEEVVAERHLRVLQADLDVSFYPMEVVPSFDGIIKPFIITATVSNNGQGLVSHPVVAELQLQNAVLMVPGSDKRWLGGIPAATSKQLSWLIFPSSETEDHVAAHLTIQGEGLYERATLKVPMPKESPRLELRREAMASEEWSRIVVYAYDLAPFYEALIDISFSGDVEVAHVTRDTLMAGQDRVLGNVFHSVDGDTKHVQVVLQSESEIRGTGPLLSINVTGEGLVHIDRFHVYSDKGSFRSTDFPVRTYTISLPDAFHITP